MADTRNFYDGFEDGTANKWLAAADHDKSSVVTVSADGGLPYSGTYMARCRYNPALLGAFDTLQADFGALHTNRGFLRTRWRIDANAISAMQANNSNLHWHRFFQGSGVPSAQIYDWMLNTAFSSSSSPPTEMVDVADLIGDNSTDLPRSNVLWPPNSTWHKLERFWDYPNKIIRVWFDGVLKINYNLTSFSSVHYDHFYLASNWNGSPATTADFLFDEIEMYGDIVAGDGTATTGSMDDASIQVVSSDGSGAASSAGAGTMIVVPNNVANINFGGTGDLQAAGVAYFPADASIAGFADMQEAGASTANADASLVGTGDAQMVGTFTGGGSGEAIYCYDMYLRSDVDRGNTPLSYDLSLGSCTDKIPASQGNASLDGVGDLQMAGNPIASADAAIDGVADMQMQGAPSDQLGFFEMNGRGDMRMFGTYSGHQPIPPGGGKQHGKENPWRREVIKRRKILAREDEELAAQVAEHVLDLFATHH